MKIRVLDEAEEDIEDGWAFYEGQESGVGDYFLTALAADIDSLILFAGIHPMHFGYHRLLSKRFPFGVYYLVENEVILIYAVLDLRRDPAWIRRRLSADER